MTLTTKTVTALKRQRNRERINVYLDEKFAFGLSEDIARDLKTGQQLSAVEIERLKEADGYRKAFNDALRYLGVRQRSRWEIEAYLRRKGYADEIVEAAVSRLDEYNYLDDEAFARSWVADRERFRPRGARALRQELRQKGIDDEIIAAVLVEVDEEHSALAALEPKLARWLQLDEHEFRKKVWGFLGRRGFGYEVIRRVTERVLANE